MDNARSRGSDSEWSYPRDNPVTRWCSARNNDDVDDCCSTMMRSEWICPKHKANSSVATRMGSPSSDGDASLLEFVFGLDDSCLVPRPRRRRSKYCVTSREARSANSVSVLVVATTSKTTMRAIFVGAASVLLWLSFGAAVPWSSSSLWHHT